MGTVARLAGLQIRSGACADCARPHARGVGTPLPRAGSAPGLAEGSGPPGPRPPTPAHGAPGVPDQLHLSGCQGEDARALLKLFVILWN